MSAYEKTMCGRATLVVPGEEIREVFGVEEVPELPPRFNIAPSQPLLVCRELGKVELLKWGPKFVNAKIENATVKPENRCLVILDGFYEWRNGDRQPFYFTRKDKRPFAVGGVTRSTAAECAIVTCPADEQMTDLHSRMPLVLTPDEWSAWLAGKKPTASLEGYGRYAVSKVVNSPRNDDPRCIEPIEDLGIVQQALFGPPKS